MAGQTAAGYENVDDIVRLRKAAFGKKPLFRAFAEKFDAPFNEAMAFGIWLHLHSIHSAPAAEDVPADNTRSIVAFLLEYRRKVQERRYTPTAAKVQTPISYFHRPELLFGRNSESPAIPTYA